MSYRERCQGPGHKEILPTKAEAQAELKVFKTRHNGRGHSYRCSWGDHYHVTTGLMGRRGPIKRRRTQ
jgi:hypothetical protein